ncbi:MAG: signal peptidase I [Lachnospiraceae bacterium]|jgi:signal peptidase I|nr:signal peptidase I [Lachnospiraceae bacterium]
MFKNKFKEYLRENYRFLLSLVIILSVGIMSHTIFAVSTVDGKSMENSLHNHDNVIINKQAYKNSEPKRFDICVFKPYANENTYYIKRIIGLPGETVQIKLDENTNNYFVYIDGKRLNEDVYGKENILNPGDLNVPVTLMKDQYIVLGDNRNNSRDSRDPSVYIVNKSQIVGKADFRIFPIDRFGSLK